MYEFISLSNNLICVSGYVAATDAFFVCSVIVVKVYSINYYFIICKHLYVWIFFLKLLKKLKNEKYEN